MTALTDAPRSIQSDLPSQLSATLLESLAGLATHGPAAETTTATAPYTGSPLAPLPTATPDAVRAAFVDTRAAQRTWAATSISDRARILLRFHDLVLERQEEILDLMQTENGKTRRDAFLEVAARIHAGTVNINDGFTAAWGSIDPDRMVIFGDSVGGNMAIALNLMGHERGDVSFRGAALFYPVANAAFDTESYQQFAEGYFLAREGMKWFWDQYTTDESQRAEITASPLRATEEQLAFFSPTMIITAEADVLRDEGEAFAAKLRRAGVKVTQVRYGGIIHDFVMVNSMHETPQSKAAVAHLKRLLEA